MRVCVLSLVFDAFRGGTHLPLFSALPEIQWTILTSRVTPPSPVLPPNVTIETFGLRHSPYYYGVADYRFAKKVLANYPPEHQFWRQFSIIHLNQVMGTPFLRLQDAGHRLLYFVHHPVSVDRELALAESCGWERLRWSARYALLPRWQSALVRDIRHVATVSSASARRIASDYGRAESNICLVPNGVDGCVFQPSDLARTDFDVIAVGSLMHPRKGFVFLLELYRLLSASGWRIADVGRRSESQEAALAAIPGVRILGMVDHARLVSLLQRSATLVSTSLYEGFGLSLVEALACGRPAFAFDAGATGEVLRPVDPSLVVPLRDVHALAMRIHSFLTLSLEERVKRGEAYRERVLEQYPLARSAETLMSLYRNMGYGSLHA